MGKKILKGLFILISENDDRFGKVLELVNMWES